MRRQGSGPQGAARSEDLLQPRALPRAVPVRLADLPRGDGAAESAGVREIPRMLPARVRAHGPAARDRAHRARRARSDRLPPAPGRRIAIEQGAGRARDVRRRHVQEDREKYAEGALTAGLAALVVDAPGT